MRADDATILALLRAYAKEKNLQRGAQVHACVLKRGLLEKSSNIAQSLVTFYARCGLVVKAQELLDGLHAPGLFCWTALISAYAQQGQGHSALKCYKLMQQQGVSADIVTFTCILKACGTIGALAQGEQIHDQIAQQGLLDKDLVLGTSLVDMYAKCGALSKAQRVLEELPFRDVISWNAVITGYVLQGQGQDALDCFARMQHEGLSPNAVTFTCMLKACGSIGAIEKGGELHDAIVKEGLLKKDVMLGNALVDMYVKCGALVKAKYVLEELPSRDVVSWSVLIAGYAQQGQDQDALGCFKQMRSEGLLPNAVTLMCILKACSGLGAAEKGKEIHDQIIREGLLKNNVALGNALVDMYAKCGALDKAREVLDELPMRNVVSWSTLIAGYAKQGLGQDAFICLERMQHEGLSPNAVTFTCVLQACGSMGAAKRGQEVHDDIARQGLLEKNLVLGTALVDMYAKCGELAKAEKVMDDLGIKDVVSWSALIAGYAEQGCGDSAVSCFKAMQLQGLSPDRVTFSSVLNACSHSGLVHEGELFFDTMSSKFGIEPDLEHYTSMVSLFGQAGYLDKAISVIQRMPSSHHSAAWFSFLGACKRWGDVNIGKWAFQHAINLGKGIVAPRVCRADSYTADGMQEDAKVLETMRVERSMPSSYKAIYAS